MELGDPEAIGVLDDHHRGLGDVHADLDDRGGHQHLEPPGPELGHHPLLLRRGELAVEEPDPQAGQLRGGQTLGLGHHRRGLDPFRPLDQRAHHEGPVAGGDLVAHPLPRLGRPGPAPRSQAVVTGSRPGGSSSMMVMSRSPKTTMAAVRGMGVAVITSRSGHDRRRRHHGPWPAAPPAARRRSGAARR